MTSGVVYIERIREYFLAEQQRWILWLPVGLGIGVGLFFASPSEPPLWYAPAVLVALSALAFVLYRRTALAWIVIAFLVIAAGASLATWRAHVVAAPVLTARWGPAELAGRVVAVEPRPEGRRLILERLVMRGLAPDATPERVRVKIPETARRVLPGEFVSMRAQLVPPPEPVAPGAYDFARMAWFARLGGVGSARGDVVLLVPSDAPDWRHRMDALRWMMVERVLAFDPGPAGQITAALLTGEMGQIAPDVMEAMRDSGLAHLLSISGLHISLVAAIVFFAVRRGLALVPPLALRLPTKKIAAVAAFLAISFYTLFAAPGVPTTRAWIMGSIVIFAILVDRAAVSLRLVAAAALVILVTKPEAMLGPSFQMSFAAVVALIAVWEWWGRVTMRRREEETGLLRRAALSLAGALLTTLVASLATTPFALYHFNRVALAGVLANLVAVPLTSILVMPAAVAAFLLWPFGADAPALAVMNWGNELVLLIAHWSAALPGAAMTVRAPPLLGLVAIVLGGLWLALWSTRWRLAGLLPIVVGFASPLLVEKPLLLASGDGRMIAVRGDDHALVMLPPARGNAMARETWSRITASDARLPTQDDRALNCAGDGSSCRLRRHDHHLVVVNTPRELARACDDATILVTRLIVWRECIDPLLIIDGRNLARDGAHALRVARDGSIVVETVRAVRGERRWVRPAATPVSNGG
jgi:competence protein ComEC